MESSIKKEIRQTIKDFFASRNEVIFVYLFGSIINQENFRDIDTAVYLDGEPDLISLGKLQAGLDDLFDYNVDLVVLNQLPKKNPAFAYEVMTAGELLLNKNSDTHTDYKSKVYRYYFDTAYLRNQFQDTFRQRLKSRKFGERDYE